VENGDGAGSKVDILGEETQRLGVS
jgi:hypothetical protein